MSGEWITVLAVETTLDVAILGFMWGLHRELHREMSNLRDRMANLHERMARLEGLFQGFTGRPPAEAQQPTT